MTLWHQIVLDPQPAAVGQPGPLPPAVRGLAPATLADLTVLAGSVPELADRGWWPVTKVDEDLAAPRLVSGHGSPRVEIASPLAPRRQVLRAAADQALALRLAAGCTLPAGSGVVQVDDLSQARISAMVGRATAAQIGAATWAPAFAWRRADNTWLALPTPAAMLALGEAVADMVIPLRAHYWILVDALAAAQSHAALSAIDIEGGWPETGNPGA